MTVQLKSWGNSQGIRIPKEILDTVGVQVNDYLEIEIVEGNILLKKQIRHKTPEERMAAYGGRLDLSEEIDWGKPADHAST